MRAAIIDDLPLCRKELREYLNWYLAKQYAGEEPVIEEFGSGEDFLAGFTPAAWDIIFIDQYMDGLSGICTAQRIRETDELTALIFVTTSRDHAIESYGVRACGYLVKPFVYADFEKTMELARVDKIRNARFIRVEQEQLLLRDILWCERDDHYVEIHTVRRGLLRFRMAAGELNMLLSPFPQFLNCYKNCIANLDRVERIDGDYFLMDNGDRVPFAVRKRKEIERLFRGYVLRREREDELL